MSGMIENVEAVIKAEIMSITSKRNVSYKNIAKAAILAMREPTDEMVDCGQDARLDGGGYYDIWRAMIDAALVED